MADLFRLSASEAAARIGEGKLTSEALVRSCLERIDSREPQVKAWVHLDRDFALSQARECDKSANRGPLHGIPFAAKDIMDSADLPTEYGSPIYKGNRPKADAACVALSRAAGAVSVAATAVVRRRRIRRLRQDLGLLEQFSRVLGPLIRGLLGAHAGGEDHRDDEDDLGAAPVPEAGSLVDVALIGH